MPTKKVFLSSTARDLKEYREAAYRAIEGLDGYHCVRMEDFGARDWDADEFCRAKVGECDLFVGILGHLYGSCPKGCEKSYTEREYDAAVGAEIPRLMFVAPDSVRPLPSLRERDEIWEKQQAFRERVNKDRMRDEFTSPENLATNVTQAIRNWEHENVVRKCTSCINKSIPFPPNPYFAHPYPPPSNFTGREAERQMLTNWLNDDERQILALVAIGGMGKSFLCWYWIHNDVIHRDVDTSYLEGILWWSFYEGELSFTKFLNESIAYIGKHEIDPISLQSDFDKTRILIKLLEEHRFLLVLDGFERQLRSYDPTNVGDLDNGNLDEQTNGRSCFDPNAARFLRDLSSGISKTKILITSRIMIRDLEDQTNSPLAYCRREDLNSLDSDDAVRFMRKQGVDKGNSAEIKAECSYYGYHPSSLRFLSSLIANDKKNPGDISVAPRHNIHADLRARRHHILEVAYNSLPDNWQLLLSKASAFRSTITYDALLSISDEFYDEGEFEKALNGLVDWGLMLFDKERVRFDLHPIVRVYAYDRLKNKIDVHSHLIDYFGAIQPREKVQSLDDLTQVVELYYHTAKAKQYDEAFQIYNDYISEAIYYKFGAYLLKIDLLKNLFPDGMDNPPKLKNGLNIGDVLNKLANAYSNFGQPRPAVRAYNSALEFVDKFGKTGDKVICRENLASQQINLGELTAAEQSLKRRIKGKMTDFHTATLHMKLGVLLAHQGDFTKAGFEFTTALKLLNKRNFTQAKCVLYAHRAWLYLVMKRFNEAFDAADHCFEFWVKIANEKEPYERDRIQAEWVMGETKTSLAREKKEFKDELMLEAEKHLNEALTRCRNINLVQFEPEILLTFAKWCYLKNDIQQTGKYIQEALYIAERCEYRLNKAEIYNFLAQIALDSGDAESAESHSKVAYKYAWCDGPPHCYKPALDEAEAILLKLGVEPPRIE